MEGVVEWTTESAENNFGIRIFRTWCLCGEKEFGYLTAETQRTRSKEFLGKKYSELCELRVSVVNKDFGCLTADARRERGLSPFSFNG